MPAGALAGSSTGHVYAWPVPPPAPTRLLGEDVFEPQGSASSGSLLVPAMCGAFPSSPVGVRLGAAPHIPSEVPLSSASGGTVLLPWGSHWSGHPRAGFPPPCISLSEAESLNTQT